MAKTKKKEVQKQGLRPSQKAKAEKLRQKQATKAQQKASLSPSTECKPSVSSISPSTGEMSAELTERVKISSSSSDVIARSVSNEAIHQTIHVKNAEGDPDTVAEILIQNKINYIPKVSVVMPVYNVEPYLRQCLDSVINQTLKEIEIICVDDGSTDASLDILKEYAEKDNRITVITQKNAGSGKARNNAMDNSKGEFIAFMDSDDMYPNDKTLEHLYEAAIKNNVLICGGSLSQLREGGKIVTDPKEFEEGYSFNKEGLMNYADYQFDYGYWRFIYNRQFLKENQLYFPDYLRQQDPPFFVKTMAVAGKFYAITEPTYVYRISYKQISWTERKAVDVAKALTDILTYTKAYNLELLHHEICKRICSNYFINIFKVLSAQKKYYKALYDLINSIDYDIIFSRDKTFSLPLFYKSLSFCCKISVIIPVYNVEKYLEECLDSVITQTYKNLEIICVDDGSTDTSLSILKKYQKLDKRIIVITQKNQGLPNARNSGLKICKGQYIMFLDSDDWIDENYIEKMHLNITRYDANMAKSGYKHHFPDCIMDDKLNKTINDRYDRGEFLEAYENNIIVCATLYDYGYLAKNQILYFDKNILKHEDILYTLKAVTLANKIVPVKDVYYHYRRASSVLSTFNYEVHKIYPQITSKAVDYLNTCIFLDKKKYVKLAQRIVWRVLDAYERLNQIKDFDRERIRYLDNINKSFIQLEYKKEIFTPYINILKRINYKEFDSILENNNKKIIVIEINNCHGECLPSYIRYFQNLGYIVDVLINEQQKKELPLYMFNNISITYASEEKILSFLNSTSLEKYKICLFNSNVVYSQKNKSIFELFNNTQVKTKFLCVEHRLENIPILSQKAICIVLKNFRKTHLAYEVNPHYFGNVTPHNRNKIINFIVVGNIEGRRKNYGILLDAVQRLNDQNIKNFKITVVGKGNVLDIPENICSYFDIKGRLSYPDMYNEMQNADYFLPLLDPESNEHKRYIKTGTSGSFQLIYGFNIPCIIARKFAHVHGFNNLNSIIYKNNDDLSVAMQLAISQTKSDYQGMQSKLSAYSKALYQKSLENLRLALTAKVSKRHFYLPYFLFPYYLIRTKILRKKVLDSCIDMIKTQLSKYRVDIRNFGNKANDVSVFADNVSFSNITWYKEQGGGKYIQGSSISNIIRIKAINDGILKLEFKGQDYRYNDRRFPVWIDYKSIKIDSKEILSEPISTWHNQPYYYEIPVKDGQEITLEIEQQYHEYTESELKNILLKLNCNDKHIIDNINLLITKLKKQIPTIDDKIKRYRTLEKCISNIYLQLIGYRIDVRNTGDKSNDVEVATNNASISNITWNKEQGGGKYIQGSSLSCTIKVSAINDGVIALEFKGQDQRFENKRYPIWIDYKSIKIDGKEILSNPIITWHNKPYRYEVPVKDGQEIKLEIEQQYHEYTESELKDVILKLNQNSEYIKENIDIISEKFKKIFPVFNIKNQFFISLGENGFVRTVLTRKGLKPTKEMGELSCPFDLCVSSLPKTEYIIRTLFSDYFDGLEFDEKKGMFVNNKLALLYNHDTDCLTKQDLINRYRNRINNFISLQKNKELVFVASSVEAQTDYKSINSLYNTILFTFKNTKVCFIFVDISKEKIQNLDKLLKEIHYKNIPNPYPNYWGEWYKYEFYNSPSGKDFENNVCNFIEAVSKNKKSFHKYSCVKYYARKLKLILSRAFSRKIMPITEEQAA